MARTGLRMMPTFPLPPLKFRTAGFPRYGFKAGISDEAFPANRFAIVLRALCCHRYSLPCVRDDALIITSVRAVRPLYPRGPRSGPGYAVPVHHHLPGPIRPTHRHSTTSPHSGLYALPSLCARLRRLGDPRVVPCFRWHPFSTCRPPGPREAQRLHIPSSFAADAGLRLKGKVSALPTSPHSDSRGGVQFRGFTTVRFRCDLSICSPSCRS